MIRYKITKHKPRIRAVSSQQNYGGMQSIGYNTSWRKINTQEEFINWVNGHPFKIGCLVTLSIDPIKDSHQIHGVVGISQDYPLLDWDRSTGLPKCFRLAQVFTPHGSSIGKWVRWDSPAGYRLISAEEYKTFIEPNHDSVQNHFNEFNASTEVKPNPAPSPF